MLYGILERSEARSKRLQSQALTSSVTILAKVRTGMGLISASAPSSVVTAESTPSAQPDGRSKNEVEHVTKKPKFSSASSISDASAHIIPTRHADAFLPMDDVSLSSHSSVNVNNHTAHHHHHHQVHHRIAATSAETYSNDISGHGTGNFDRDRPMLPVVAASLAPTTLLFSGAPSLPNPSMTQAQMQQYSSSDTPSKTSAPLTDAPTYTPEYSSTPLLPASLPLSKSVSTTATAHGPVSSSAIQSLPHDRTPHMIFEASPRASLLTPLTRSLLMTGAPSSEREEGQLRSADCSLEHPGLERTSASMATPRPPSGFMSTPGVALE